MNIIFVCTRSITFNTFLASQAKFLSKQGYKIKIACADIENLNFRDSSNFKIDFPTKYIHLLSLVRFIKIFFQINKLISKNKSNIYYLHTPVASHLFRLFAIFYKLKIVYFVHGFRFTSKTRFLRATFYKVIEKILSFKTNIFITINNEDYLYAKNHLFNSVPTYKINGIGLDLKKKISKKNFKNKKIIKKIVVIAGYKKIKGYYNLLKAAELLKGKNFKIDCYGYGDYAQFESIKIKRKLNNIFFKKFEKNLKSKIRKYDLLLHLSKREGLPVAVMECLIDGVPVICKNIRGNSDLIKNGINGLFVDSYREVPNKILYLNLENKVFNQMRYNAINTITKSFSKKEINKSIHNIIRKNFK
jgi:glycosyltransferase EpsD